MAGRPRKAGKREPNGRPQRDLAWQVKEAVAVQRCRRMGWKPYRLDGEPNHDVQREAVRATYGTEQGILLGRRLITAEQHLAANEYQATDARYRRVNGLSPPHASALDQISPGGRLAQEELDPEYIAWVTRRYRDMERALIDAHATMVAMRVCILQMEPSEEFLPALRRGLSAVYRSVVRGDFTARHSRP